MSSARWGSRPLGENRKPNERMRVASTGIQSGAMSSTASTSAGPSLAGRLTAAIALTIGFYVLALALGLGLLAVPVLEVLNGWFNLWLTITALFLGV